MKYKSNIEIALEAFLDTYSIQQPSKTKLKYPLPFYVREALGLLPWDELDKRGYYYSGQTTKMLVEAVYFSQNRKVYIAGYNHKYTNVLVNQAKEMCSKLNIPHANIFALPKNLKGLKFEDTCVYLDHYRKD